MRCVTNYINSDTLTTYNNVIMRHPSSNVAFKNIGKNNSGRIWSNVLRSLCMECRSDACGHHGDV